MSIFFTCTVFCPHPGMQVYRNFCSKFCDFRKFCPVHRVIHLSRKFSNISGQFDFSDLHLCSLGKFGIKYSKWLKHALNVPPPTKKKVFVSGDRYELIQLAENVSSSADGYFLRREWRDLWSKDSNLPY